MVQGLTVLHIVCGSLALFSSTVAIVSKVISVPHRVHAWSGIAFVNSMIGITATAIPLSVIRTNILLLLIAIFSLYLALSGWRLATNRTGVQNAFDLTLVWGMTLTGLVMIGFGGWLYSKGSSMAVVVAVFGCIGVFLSQLHRNSVRRNPNNQRIVMHLTSMLGGTIATWTAFTVTQISYNPPWIPWLAPTAIFLPLIIIMRRKEKRKLV